jgi:dynein heavy chain, axonemal
MKGDLSIKEVMATSRCAYDCVQGQEKVAESVMDKYMKDGGWVFLDNVHLMQGWLSTLEGKLETAAEAAHPDFRCFFSAEPINGAPQVGSS